MRPHWWAVIIPETSYHRRAKGCLTSRVYHFRDPAVAAVGRNHLYRTWQWETEARWGFGSTKKKAMVAAEHALTRRETT